MQTSINYRGRFAPSPTGPLHFGSLIAAVASYCDAKHHNGIWFVRIDDIDHQRCKPEHSDSILKTLEAFGFEWDGDVVYQQARQSRYKAALDYLDEQGLSYRCQCSRKILPDGPYPGTCRDLQIQDQSSSVRIKTHNNKLAIDDLIQGNYEQDLAKQVGDFVIYRADQMVNYHLATVCDDADANITHIIRGADLLDSTPRQVYLQVLLNLPTPVYGHFGVALNQNGEKLSKQTFATAVSTEKINELLLQSLAFLNQTTDSELINSSTSDIFDWAIKHWDRTKLPVANRKV